MPIDLIQLREQHKAAKLTNETAILQAETAAITGIVFPGMVDPAMPQQPLQEAWGDRVPWTEHPAGERDRVFGLGGRLAYSFGAEIGDRRDGSNQIVFSDETELARIRAIGRYLADCSANGQAVLENLTSYILGTGYTYKVVAQDGETPNEQLIVAVQAVVNEFLRENRWTIAKEEELFRRSRRDGETFTAIYHVGNGHVQMRVLEPEQITEPADPEELVSLAALPDIPLSYSYGIFTKDDDMEKVFGYAARFVTDAGRDQWMWYPESRIVHCKRNVDGNIKRGVSDFFAVYEQLIDAGKLLRNTARGHAIMSAIAFIRENAQGVTGADAEGMRSAGAWSNYTQVTRNQGSRTRFTHHYEPGTIVDVPHGQQYKPGPMASQGVGEATVTVENAILQIAGSKWAMPSYMITGTTDTNYAATLVTEAPWIKYCQRQQKWHREHYAELIWKALRISHAAGRFFQFGATFEQLQRLLDLHVDVPIVHSRDRTEETNRRKILSDAGLISPPTWAAEEGLDYEQEQELGAKKQAPPNPFGGNPFGDEEEGDKAGFPVDKETHPRDKSGEQPFRGREQPDAGKYESHSRLSAAAALLWEGYPAETADVVEGADA